VKLHPSGPRVISLKFQVLWSQALIVDAMCLATTRCSTGSLSGWLTSVWSALMVRIIFPSAVCISPHDVPPRAGAMLPSASRLWFSASVTVTGNRAAGLISNVSTMFSAFVSVTFRAKSARSFPSTSWSDEQGADVLLGGSSFRKSKRSAIFGHFARADPDLGRVQSQSSRVEACFSSQRLASPGVRDVIACRLDESIRFRTDDVSRQKVIVLVRALAPHHRPTFVRVACQLEPRSYLPLPFHSSPRGHNVSSRLKIIYYSPRK
jgi:hypothetical protein